jgi:hypothetical protein
MGALDVVFFHAAVILYKHAEEVARMKGQANFLMRP